MPARPEKELVAVEDAYSRVFTTITTLTDAAAREPSSLPGWTRGHLLTHLARNADGNRNMVEGAIAGEEREQYPGGAEQRADDIEAGAHRAAEALIEDFRLSHAALVDAWRRVPDDAWTRAGLWLATGRRPISSSVGSRWRELLVHLVDLDLGVNPSDLPADFVAEQQSWLREFRTEETWPGARW